MMRRTTVRRVYKSFTILGGAGLCGYQVCRSLMNSPHFNPEVINVCSLGQDEAESTCQRLAEEFPASNTRFKPAWGNIMVPAALANTPRAGILEDAKSRKLLLDNLYGDAEVAFNDNKLTQLLREHKPEVLVDCMNTATGFSYQDVFDGAAKVRECIKESGVDAQATADIETFLLSQSVPQLVRHVTFLNRATTEVGTKMYVKIGTTGTGGMGLNIPYTHSEDKPSKKLLAKTEAAFGHTGLLFLMGRTPDSPIVKEIKPAAMIGYRKVSIRGTTDRYGNNTVFEPERLEAESATTLELRGKDADYKAVGKLNMALVDTGENGVFSRGEFGAITSMGSMEFITPEEIAERVVKEIRGQTTGYDIISALDSTVMGPTFKAGLLRRQAMKDLDAVEASGSESSNFPSVALGKLGPPELSKLLFEASLFKHHYNNSLASAVQDTKSSSQLAAALSESLFATKAHQVAPSIGVPVLLPNGTSVLRGPRINVPELLGHSTSVPMDMAALDRYATKGWVDLRPTNVEKWRSRFQLMAQSHANMQENGSAAATCHTYLGGEGIDIGEMVGWITRTEMTGFRYM